MVHVLDSSRLFRLAQTILRSKPSELYRVNRGNSVHLGRNQNFEARPNPAGNSTNTYCYHHRHNNHHNQHRNQRCSNHRNKRRKKNAYAPANSGCPHHLGYLNQREKSQEIPAECFACQHLIQCMDSTNWQTFPYFLFYYIMLGNLPSYPVFPCKNLKLHRREV
jgi:hypothetical protein